MNQRRPGYFIDGLLPHIGQFNPFRLPFSVFDTMRLVAPTDSFEYSKEMGCIKFLQKKCERAIQIASDAGTEPEIRWCVLARDRVAQ